MLMMWMVGGGGKVGMDGMGMGVGVEGVLAERRGWEKGGFWRRVVKGASCALR